MRILHISLGLPPFRSGGLTKYCLDLMLTQLEQMHEVCLVYPGQYRLGKMVIRKEKVERGIHVYEIVNPLPVPLLGGINKPDKFMKTSGQQEYDRFLREIKPDIIHVHTLMGIHKEFLTVAKALGIKTVYTTHDYFGLCPKANLLDSEGRPCNDYSNGSKCVACNYGAYSDLALYLMQSKFYRRLKNSPAMRIVRSSMKRRSVAGRNPVSVTIKTTPSPKMAGQYVNLRSYYTEMLQNVDLIHYNSSLAESVYTQYLSSKGRQVSITHRDIKDQRQIRKFHSVDQPLRITYLGPVDSYKGFFLLQQSLEKLKSSSLKWHLNVYGDSSGQGSVEFSDRCTFHGKYSYEQLEHIFKHTDLLIIPSIWKETFGFIGLEALSFAIPMLVSEYVGFKDWIRDGVNGILFRPSVEDLAEKLEGIIQNRDVLALINNNICETDHLPSMDHHSLEMSRMYDSIMRTKIR